MPSQARQPALLRPTTIAVHDDGDVTGNGFHGCRNAVYQRLKDEWFCSRSGPPTLTGGGLAPDGTNSERRSRSNSCLQLSHDKLERFLLLRHAESFESKRIFLSLLEPLSRLLPAGQFDENRHTAFKLTKVAGRNRQRFSSELIGDADFDTVDLIESVKVGYGQLVNAINH